MSAEYNLCPKCGGIKDPVTTAYPRAFGLCRCTSTPKHDDIPGRAHTPEQKRAIIEHLYALWLHAPELRLAQLVYNATGGRDIFYLEDEALLGEITGFVDRLHQGANEVKEKPGYLAHLRTLSKEELINELYNKRVAEWADFDDDDNPPDSNHRGKRIPYIGWFWRHADFADRRISIGDTGGYIGVMENNKWGYRERLMTPEEVDTFTGYLDRAFAENSKSGDKAQLRANAERVFAELRQWFQALEVK